MKETVYNKDGLMPYVECLDEFDDTNIVVASVMSDESVVCIVDAGICEIVVIDIE